MTRQIRTPRARAEEALAVAQRRVTRLEKERTKHRAALNRVTSELEEAVVRRDYLKGHPDLKQEPATPTPTETP